MSSFLAIGGVSSTLRSLLHDRMELPTGITRNDLRITVSTPQEEDDDEAERPRINMFLYRTTENPASKNQMIPGEGHPSEYGHPPLSLVLHYLLTPYGTTDDNGVRKRDAGAFPDGQRHPRDARLSDHHRVAMTVNSPPTEILHESFRGEFERIKICLDPISLEDLSKVWTALTRPYRPVGCVFDQRGADREPAHPHAAGAGAHASHTHVDTKRPEIKQVYRSPVAPGDPIGNIHAQIGQQLTIEGANFIAARTWVKVGTLSRSACRRSRTPRSVSSSPTTSIRSTPITRRTTDSRGRNCGPDRSSRGPDAPAHRSGAGRARSRRGRARQPQPVLQPFGVPAGAGNHRAESGECRQRRSRRRHAHRDRAAPVRGGTKSVVLVGDTVLPVIDADPVGNPQQDNSVHASLSALANQRLPFRLATIACASW